jgi:hypothetical protein
MVFLLPLLVRLSGSGQHGPDPPTLQNKMIYRCQYWFITQQICNKIFENGLTSEKKTFTGVLKTISTITLGSGSAFVCKARSGRPAQDPPKVNAGPKHL